MRFRYKGGRNYVHGTDMYNTFVAQIQTLHPLTTTSAIKLVIHRFGHKQCEMIIGEPNSQLSKPEQAFAEFSVETAHGVVKALLVETDQPITERYEYHEDRIEEACSIHQEKIVVEKDSGYSAIEVVVAMNKKLHNHLFPLSSERWVFTRLDLIRPLLETDTGHLMLQFLHSFSRKLTKTAIYVGKDTVGHIYFSAAPQ
jgi:hypothetical protein